MGFLDKVKEKAQVVSGQAKDKYEEVQGKRKADSLLDDLGRILYLERTGRTSPTAEADIARILPELQKLEADGIPVVTKSAAASGDNDVTPSGDTDLPPPVTPT